MKKVLAILLLLASIFISFNSPPVYAAKRNSKIKNTKISPAVIFKNNADLIVTIYTKNEDDTYGSGSGFFIEKNGILLTNSHVIERAEVNNIIVELKNQTILPVMKIIAQDPENDFALLQVASSNNSYLKLADKLPNVGERVVVIGAPRGYSHTLTDGMLSAINRGKNGEYIQISAPVSPGSSGSPVFNDNGLVIGIVTFSDAGEASQNLNFAPSCSAIKDFLKRKPMITRKEYKIQQRRKNPKDYHVAQKGDIIFKAGDYDYAKTIELLEPIKSTLPGALGIHFWFEITAPCELAYVYSYNNCDFYAAPSNLIKSTYMGASVIARGDLIGVLVDPKKNSFGWFVDNSHYNGGMRTIWTRGFKQKEFSKIRESSSLYFDNRGNVCIVSYEGIEEDNLIIRALQIKNGQKTNNTGEVEINLKRLPGEYIIAGGVLDVDKVENGFMYYDWTEYPK